MNQLTVSYPYAKASFDFATQNAKSDKVQVSKIWELCLAHATSLYEGAHFVFEDPQLPAKAKVDLCMEFLADKLFKNSDASVVDEVKAPFSLLLLELTNAGKLNLLSSVSQQFNSLKSAAEQVLEVRISTAKNLNDAQKASLLATLKKKLSQKLQVQWHLDESLLAGFVATFDDQVMDYSLSRRVKMLKDSVS